MVKQCLPRDALSDAARVALIMERQAARNALGLDAQRARRDQRDLGIAEPAVGAGITDPRNGALIGNDFGRAATGAMFLAAGTLLADLILAYMDPRVRSGERA